MLELDRIKCLSGWSEVVSACTDVVFPLAFCLTTLGNYEGFGPLLQPQTAPASQVAQGRSVGCGVWAFERTHGEISSGCGLYLALLMPLLGAFSSHL